MNYEYKPLTPNAHKHMEICKQLNDIYEQKNKDYGDSFSVQYKKHGMLSAYIRLEDKMLRLEQLIDNDPNVENETVEDTLIDLANYAIMSAMELEESE